MKAQGMALLPRLTDMHMGSVTAAPRRAGGTYRARPTLWQRILTWTLVANERRRLLDLDEHSLKDIGLTKEEAAREASRPFWDYDGPR